MKIGPLDGIADESVHPVGERHVLSRVTGWLMKIGPLDGIADERRSDVVNQSISVDEGTPFLLGFGRGRLLHFPWLK